MSLFKKFTDFCAGIAAFVGGLFLLQKYMAFKPLDLERYKNYLTNQSKFENMDINIEEITEAPSKLRQFFDPDIINLDYRVMLILVLTLIISVLVGIIFRRLPYVCFFFSLFPAVMTVYMFGKATYIFGSSMRGVQIGLFFTAAALHMAGNVVEAIVRDREDGRHRLFVTAKISMLFPAALCLFFTQIVKKVEAIPDEAINEKLPIFKDIKIELAEPANIEILKKLGWGFVIIFVICLLLYNVYFVDVTLSAIPLVYSIYVFYASKLTFLPFVFFTLALICFLTNLALCVFENNLSHKEQMKQKARSESTEGEQPQ